MTEEQDKSLIEKLQDARIGHTHGWATVPIELLDEAAKELGASEATFLQILKIMGRVVKLEELVEALRQEKETSPAVEKLLKELET